MSFSVAICYAQGHHAPGSGSRGRRGCAQGQRRFPLFFPPPPTLPVALNEASPALRLRGKACRQPLPPPPPAPPLPPPACPPATSEDTHGLPVLACQLTGRAAASELLGSHSPSCTAGMTARTAGGRACPQVVPQGPQGLPSSPSSRAAMEGEVGRHGRRPTLCCGGPHRCCRGQSPRLARRVVHPR